MDRQDARDPQAPKATEPSIDQVALRKTIASQFSGDDLALLCADVQQALINDGVEIQVSIDSIGGKDKELRMQVLLLIDYLHKRRYLSYLVRAAEKERPGIFKGIIMPDVVPSPPQEPNFNITQQIALLPSVSPPNSPTQLGGFVIQISEQLAKQEQVLEQLQKRLDPNAAADTKSELPKGMLTCPNTICSRPVDETWIGCPDCGFRLICPNPKCAKRLPTSGRYCPHCTRKLRK